MNSIKCPHCGGASSSEILHCPMCGKDLHIGRIEALRQRQLAAAQIAEAKKRQDSRSATWGVIAILIGITLLGGLFVIGKNQSDASNAADAKQALEDSRKFNGYCAGLQAAADETTIALGNLGQTSTLEDVLSVLKSNGESLQGYRYLIKNKDQAKVVRDAADEMLHLRVLLVDGGPVLGTAANLRSDLLTITTICSG